jgi:catechol 2,3-dioxygenase-like lactoylglutathione lyase family enzyme
VSYVTLATDSFEEVTRFYGKDLEFPVLETWDRAIGRGRRFDLGGITLEILHHARERRSLTLGIPADRVHLVVEVADIDTARSRVQIPAPRPEAVSWGARLFQVRDPDGIPVTFIEWDAKGPQRP